MAGTPFGNGIDLKGQRAVHAADGSASDDLATWGQVQAFLAGLAWKAGCRAASTTNVSISSAPSSIDGVALASGDRVLLKDQTVPSENGIRVFTSAGAALARATDMDSAAETKSATVTIAEGTANHDTAWTQTADSVTLDTTSLTFVAFGAGATYTNGNGLNLSGGVFSIKLPGSGVVGLIVDSTGVYIDTSVVVRKYSADIGNGSATSFVIPHNFGTKDVSVTIRQKSDDAGWITDWVATDTNNVTVTFGFVPTSAQFRATVHA